MGAASAKAYVDENNNQGKKGKGQVNTNIFLINFQFLLEKLFENYSRNIPKCGKCQAFYNKYSHQNLISKAELIGLQPDAKKQGLVSQILSEYKLDLHAVLDEQNTSVWACEFCGYPNVLEGNVNLPDNEFIQLSGFFKKVEQKQQERKGEEEEKSEEKVPTYNGEQLIYVLDNSGSMASVETYIKNGEKISLSRKKSIISSIEEQSIAFMTGNEKKEVSLVVFSNDVELYTSVHNKPEVINGQCLEVWDQLVARCSNLADKMEGSPADKIDDLLTIYRKANKMGSTALGPAVLASVEVAKASRGSQVIICTDGMANTGLGKMNNANEIKEANKFYDSVAEFAKGKGVQISILGIGDEKMGMKEIGQLAEKTNGSVFKIDLSNLNSKLDNILSDKMIASDVKLKLILHKNVKLDEEVNDSLDVDVGNATKESCLTFEYLFDGIKPEQLSELKSIPFQAHIEYTDLNGQRQLIVVTKSIELTNNRKAVEDHLDIHVVEKRMAQKSANLIQKGDAKHANEYQQNWNDFIENNSNYNEYAPQLLEQQEMVQEIARDADNGMKCEKMQVRLQQMHKGKFWS